jgi:6-phosphogluconolactonase
MTEGARLRVYVGTFTEPIVFGTGQILYGKGKGIYNCDFDTRTGRLDVVDVASPIRNPSYLTVSNTGRRLYCTNEIKSFREQPTGAVSAYAVEQSGLRLLNQRPTGGTDPCHVELDRTGRYLFVANFMSGSIRVFPIGDDGELMTHSDHHDHLGSSADPVRQTGSHAHSCVVDPQNRYVLVPDLGLDQTLVYELNPTLGKLRFVSALPAEPGAGPRHAAFAPDGTHGFVINELNCTLISCTWDPNRGLLEPTHNVSTLPTNYHGAGSCADLHVDPGGRYVFGSNRGHNTIVVFRRDQTDGQLTIVGHYSSGGSTPRNFAVAPNGEYILAANQDTDNVVVLRADPMTGALESVSETAVPTPVCVRFAPP